MIRIDVNTQECNLGAIIMQLPEVTSLVITLHYFEKLKQKEIAQKLNLSIAITRKHLVKGKYAIRKLSACREYKDAYKILYGK